MKPVIFLFSAYMMGFLAAVPAGPVQIEVIRRSINGHMRSSFMVIAGALIADIIYGVIALFGIAPFLNDEKVMAVFWLNKQLELFSSPAMHGEKQNSVIDFSLFAKGF